LVARRHFYLRPQKQLPPQKQLSAKQFENWKKLHFCYYLPTMAKCLKLWQILFMVAVGQKQSVTFFA